MEASFGPASIRSATSPESAPDAVPKLLLELEPWGQTFLRNVLDAVLFRRPPRVPVSSQSGEFWPDVFVTRRLPWAGFFESGLAHGLALAALVILGRAWALRPQPAPRARFDLSQVIYYTPSEYLPLLDTGPAVAKQAADTGVAPARKGEPQYAKQPILSVPPEVDNHEQTIVTPPDLRLKQSVPTPNIVAWGANSLPVRADGTGRSGRRLTLPEVTPPPEVARDAQPVSSLAPAVVAPPPRTSVVAEHPSLQALQSAVIVPPPAVDADASRPLGNMNLSAVAVPPTPKLGANAERVAPTLNDPGREVLAAVPPPPEVEDMGRVGSSHSVTTQASLREAAAPVVPPPPTMQGSGNSVADGRMIALGIHPAAVAPPEPPRGNRRGEFSASPEGRPGAPGTADVLGDNNSGRHGAGRQPGTAAEGVTREAPPGLHVGAAPGGTPGSGAPGPGSASPGGPAATASARQGGPALPKAVPDTSADPEVGALAQQVFGERRIYAMTLNMPNLNSGGGSWVIRFAELNHDGNEGDLSAPVPQHKVDPAYPIELMRQNVGGMVALRAVIRADGSVGDVRLLRSVDDRLDRYAAEALSRWHFYPATRNGTPVDLEAVFTIPFKPVRHRNF
jgi:TonB family protein